MKKTIHLVIKDNKPNKSPFNIGYYLIITQLLACITEIHITLFTLFIYFVCLYFDILNLPYCFPFLILLSLLLKQHTAAQLIYVVLVICK